ncbi:hypothetical protein D9M71_754990 [compost metagenome]
MNHSAGFEAEGIGNRGVGDQRQKTAGDACLEKAAPLHGWAAFGPKVGRKGYGMATVSNGLVVIAIAFPAMFVAGMFAQGVFAKHLPKDS